MEVIGILDIGEAVVPPDDSITTAKIQDDAVTAAKLANSINTEITANTAKTGITSGQASAITANTAKVTNATHTGDVTGATALTIATDAVDIAMLSATGTASSSTFLRGDNAWAVPGGGKILQFVIAEYAPQTSYINSTSWSSTGGMSVSITPASASNNILVFVQDGVYLQTSAMHLYRIYETANSAVITEVMCGTTAGGQGGFPNYSSGYYNPANTSELTFTTQMRRMSGTSGSRMRDDQIDASGNVFHMIAMEVEG
jgi:hypothetical protein